MHWYFKFLTARSHLVCSRAVLLHSVCGGFVNVSVEGLRQMMILINIQYGAWMWFELTGWLDFVNTPYTVSLMSLIYMNMVKNYFCSEFETESIMDITHWIEQRRFSGCNRCMKMKFQLLSFITAFFERKIWHLCTFWTHTQNSKSNGLDLYIIRICIIKNVKNSCFVLAMSKQTSLKPWMANLLKRECNRKKSQSCGGRIPEIHLLL